MVQSFWPWHTIAWRLTARLKSASESSNTTTNVETPSVPLQLWRTFLPWLPPRMFLLSLCLKRQCMPAFSSDQLDQFCLLIVDTAGSQHPRSVLVHNENVTIPLLSPASLYADQGQEPQSMEIQDGLLTANLPLGRRSLVANTANLQRQYFAGNYAIHDYHRSQRAITTLETYKRILKREYTDFYEILSTNMYPINAFFFSNNFRLAINPQDSSTSAFVWTHKENDILMAFHPGLSSGMSTFPLSSPLPSPGPRPPCLPGSNLQI